MNKGQVRICEQLVPVTATGATWGSVSLDLPGVMVTGIVQTAVTSYLDVLAVSYCCSVCTVLSVVLVAVEVFTETA